MRNLKKLLAVIVAICVLASFTVPAFAATSASFTYADQAKKLYDMKLYAGNSATSYVPDLGSKLTREQGIILLVRMFGKEKDALAMTDADTVLAKYTDAAKVSSWAKKYVAYAVKTTMVSGTTATTLDAAGKLTGNAMATMILKNLGFTVDPATYATNAATLSSKGGLTADEATKFASKELIRDDVVGIMFGSLKAKDSNGKVVIDNLVASGAVSADAAKAAGVYTSVALDVSSAVAINSTTVEVKLGTAAKAADVTTAAFKVKDAAGKDIAVKSAAISPWSTDSKSVLLKLEADTTAGALYTLAVGDKTVKFGGKAKDVTKPKADKVERLDYNSVKISFTEPVDITTLKVAIEKKWDDKAALAVKNIKYDGSNAVTIETAEQGDGTLYKLTADSATDFAGNIMEKLEETFVGAKMPTDKLKTDKARSTDYNTVAILFNVKVDPATIAAANFSITEKYNTSNKLQVVNARIAAKEDAGFNKDKADTDKIDDSTAAAKQVILEVSGTLSEGALCEVAIKDLKTLYGQAQDSTELKTTYMPIKKPTELKFDGTKAEATSNTTIILYFNNKVDADSAKDVSLYSITPAYTQSGETKTPLTVTAAKRDDNSGAGLKKVKLTVSSMTDGLYKVVVTGLKDIYGNTISTSDKKNEVTFTGKRVSERIKKIEGIDRTGDNTIEVKFDKTVDEEDLKDVSHYTINYDIGYPEKAEKGGDSSKVKLTMPKTKRNVVYTLTVKGLKNGDGIAIPDSEKVEATFQGRGIDAEKPEIQGIVAIDNSTLKVYLDRSADDDTVKGTGRLWNNDTVEASTFTVKQYKSADLVLPSNSNQVFAYKDPSNSNVLVIRTNLPADQTPFKQVNLASQKSYFKLEIASEKVKSTDGKNVLEVNYKDEDPAKVEIAGVAGINSKTVRVYFNQKIKIATGGIGNVKVYSSEGTSGTLVASALRKTSTDDKVVDFIFDNPILPNNTSLTNGKAWLYIPSGTSAITDVTGIVGVKDKSDSKKYQAEEFGASDKLPEDNKITDAFGAMSDKRTIKVQFPERMCAAESGVDFANSVLNVNNYRIVANDSGSTPAENCILDLVEYNADKMIAYLYLNKDIADVTENGNTTKLSRYYLAISSNVMNEGLVVKIKDEKTGIGGSFASGLVKEFGKNGDDVAAPKLTTAKVDESRTKISIEMDSKVAFSSTTSITPVAKGTALNNIAMYEARDTDGALTAQQFLGAFKVTATFEGNTNSSEIGTSDITSVTRDKGGKKLVVTLNKKLKADSDGKIVTQTSTGATSLYIFNKAGKYNNKDGDKSELTFAVPPSVFGDTTPPTVINAFEYDLRTGALADEDGASLKLGADGRTDEVVLEFSENISDASVVAMLTGSGGKIQIGGTSFDIVDSTTEPSVSGQSRFVPANSKDPKVANDRFITIAVAAGVNGATVKDVTLTTASNDPKIKDLANNVLANIASIDLTETAVNTGVTGSNNAIPTIDGANAVAATGTITYAAAAGTVTVGGNVFTYNASSNAANNFTTADDLAADIDALTNVNATNASGVITVTAATAGAAGNSITLATTQTGGAVSGATLANGADAKAEVNTITIATGATAAGTMTVIFNDGITINNKIVNVTVAQGDTAAQVAAKVAAALTADAQIGNATTGAYTVTNTGSTVVITRNTPGAVTITISVNG